MKTYIRFNYSYVIEGTFDTEELIFSTGKHGGKFVLYSEKLGVVDHIKWWNKELVCLDTKENRQILKFIENSKKEFEKNADIHHGMIDKYLSRLTLV